MPTAATTDDRNKNKAIIELLTAAYNAELETVMNYLANAVNLDGVRAEHIKESLLADVPAELGHAQQIADRIKTIGGMVPGSLRLSWSQNSLQPPADSTDLVTVIRGVIEAEEAAISMYEQIIKACDGVDYVTQDLAITILSDEQKHRREFVGFLKEFEKEQR